MVEDQEEIVKPDTQKLCLSYVILKDQGSEWLYTRDRSGLFVKTNFQIIDRGPNDCLGIVGERLPRNSIELSQSIGFLGNMVIIDGIMFQVANPEGSILVPVPIEWERNI